MPPAAAIKAGKNVLCDKPLCLNADEAEDMLAAHREHPDKVSHIGLLHIIICITVCHSSINWG